MNTVDVGGGPRFRLSDAPQCFIKNETGETIPPRSFVKVQPMSKLPNGIWVVNAAKPDLENGSVYVVTGHCEISDGSIGSGFWPTAPVWVKYSSLPSPVATVGPAASSWQCDPNGEGFDCLAVKTDDGLAVVRAQGGGQTPKFTVHQFVPWGLGTAGSVSMTYTIPDPADGMTEKEGSIVIPWNCTGENFTTQLLTHPSIPDASYITVLDGSWPTAAISVEFKNELAGQVIAAPVIDLSGLEGGSFPQIFFLRYWQI